jgi:hypothetical protein
LQRINAKQLDIVYRNSRTVAGRTLSNASEYARNYMTELLAISVLCELIVSPQFLKSFADVCEVPPNPAYLAFNPLRLGAARPAAEFSR